MLLFFIIIVIIIKILFNARSKSFVFRQKFSKSILKLIAGLIFILRILLLHFNKFRILHN